MANIFIHFEPVGPLWESDPVFTGEMPPYIIPNSPEEPHWKLHNPNGWYATIAEPITKGATEVHLLAANGDLERLSQLLDLYPHLVNAVDDNGWTPLHAAVANLRGDVVKLLLERGADVHAITKWGDSVLRVAYHFVMESGDPVYQSQPEKHDIIQSLYGIRASGAMKL